MNRRRFLKTAGVGALALGGGVLLPSARTRDLAWASTPGVQDETVLVVVFQRGAMDGLAAVAPLDDPGYLQLRPQIGLRADRAEAGEGLLKLGASGFGLHPALAAIAPMYGEGSLAVVHGAGSPNPTRSHFDAQDYLATGTPFRKGNASGWMNRVLAGLPSGGPFRAVAFSGDPPRSLSGEEPGLALEDLRDFARRGRRLDRQLALYATSDHPLLARAAEESRQALDMLQGLDASHYVPAGEYPGGQISRSLAQIAYLIKAGVGIRLAFAESEGWDTHVQQGAARGQFANRARELAGALQAFWQDLGTEGSRVALVTLTEFGRTVAENGNRGTDHGRASCFFVMGGGIAGGRVFGSIPRLDESNLEDGRDLPVIVDYRDVLTELVSGHLGVSKQVFPDHRSAPLGLLS